MCKLTLQLCIIKVIFFAFFKVSETFNVREVFCRVSRARYVTCVQFVLVHEVCIITNTMVHVDRSTLNDKLVIVTVKQSFKQLQPVRTFSEPLNLYRRTEIN